MVVAATMTLSALPTVALRLVLAATTVSARVVVVVVKLLVGWFPAGSLRAMRLHIIPRRHIILVLRHPVSRVGAALAAVWQ